MMTTRRAACRLRRHFSSASSSSRNSSTTTTPLPSWLDRVLHLWDQESGTHEILHLKQNVNASSLAFDSSQRQVSQARSSLDRALQAFEDSQLQHTQLLQTRDRWTPSQALQFAKVLEKEVHIRKQLEDAKKELATLETQQLHAMNTYMNDVRRRYHEEQLWQDKWRIYSTFGTWGLIVLNSLVFLVSQYMYRIRENKRVEEMRGLLESSLMVNEGTLRVVQDQREMEKQGRGRGSDKLQQQIVEDESEEDIISQEGDITSINKETNVAVLEKDDNKEEGSNSQQPDATTPSSPPKPQTQSSSIHHWTRNMQQYTKNLISRKIRLPEKRPAQVVDVPSAILGASVTGMTWLVVTILSSSRRGAQ